MLMLKQVPSFIITLIIAFFTMGLACASGSGLENKAHAEALFFQWNAKKPDVISLPSGLQYKVIKQGSGKSPQLGDSVTVDYKGEFLNGHVFDSSYQHKKPAVFPLKSVIAGWQEALPLMREGAVWVLYVPSQLAYGVRGIPGVICGNETLLFQIHLIKVM